jgi:predicted nucleic acid-binding protein
MADVVVDANVLVGLFDKNDSLFTKATALLASLDAEGHVPLVLDQARTWLARGEVAFVGHDQERLLPAVFDVVQETGGKVNVNDALLVVLQREGSIGDVASFDKKLDGVAGFRRVS